MVVNNRLGYLFVFLGMSMALYAQRKTEVIRYGDLDQWVVRKITESCAHKGHIVNVGLATYPARVFNAGH